MPSASRKLPEAARASAATASGGIAIDSDSRGPRSTRRDLLDGRALEVEAVAAVDDGRRHLLGLGRREHEDGVRRRLLERLQECVPCRGGEHVRLVEDVHLRAARRRRVGDALAQLADVVDGVVRRGVHLDHVERPRLRDRDAGLADAAGLDAVGPSLAVQAGGEDLRHRGLAGAPATRRTGRRGGPCPAPPRCAASLRRAPGRRRQRTSAGGGTVERGACGQGQLSLPRATAPPERIACRR